MAGGSANSTFVNPTVVARRAIDALGNKSKFLGCVYRGYESEWAKTHNGWKPGQSINIKAPKYLTAVKTNDLNLTSKIYALTESDTTFYLGPCLSVAWEVDSLQMTYNIDKAQQEWIDPAMDEMAEKLDLEIAQFLAQNSANQVGDPTQVAKDYLTWKQAFARLTNEGIPMGERYAAYTPDTNAYLSNEMRALLHQSLVQQAVREGFDGKLAGFETFESAHLYTHTCGTRGATGSTVNGSASNGAETLDITGGIGGSETIKAGDIFTVADCYAVRPRTKARLPHLRQFVVPPTSTHTATPTVTQTASSGEYTNVPIHPGTDPFKLYDITADEFTVRPYQNCVNAAGNGGLPQNSAAVTFTGAASSQYVCNLTWHKNAIGIAIPPIAMPSSVVWGAVKSYNGISISVIRGFDVTTRKEICRFDMLLGLKMLHPQMACRVASSM